MIICHNPFSYGHTQSYSGFTFTYELDLHPQVLGLYTVALAGNGVCNISGMGLVRVLFKAGEGPLKAWLQPSAWAKLLFDFYSLGRSILKRPYAPWCWYIYLHCEAPKIAKFVNNSNFTMVYGIYNYSYWGL